MITQIQYIIIDEYVLRTAVYNYMYVIMHICKANSGKLQTTVFKLLVTTKNYINVVKSEIISHKQLKRYEVW